MSDPTEPTMLALVAVLQDRDAEQELRDDFARWLRWSGVDDQDAQTLVAQGPEAVLLYRKLVHGRLTNTIRRHLRRTTARLGLEQLAADLAAFMEIQGPRSPFLRDLPREFLTWVKAQWKRNPKIADYLLDLAEHELVGKEVANSPRGGEAFTGQAIALDKALRIDGSARLVRYDYEVHKLPKDTRDRSVPKRAHSALLVYRDREDSRVRYLSLGTLAEGVLDLIMTEKVQVIQALAQACADLGEPIDQERIGKIAALLTVLADRGIVLGAEE